MLPGYRIAALALLAALAIAQSVSATVNERRHERSRAIASVRIVDSAIPLSVGAAEAEGDAYPRGPTPDPRRTAKLDKYAGSAARRCRHAGRSGEAIRSGDFAIGRGIAMMQAGIPTKVFWIPLHDPSGAALHIRAARISAGASSPDTLRRTLVNIATTGEHTTTAFYPGAFKLPRQGEWLVVATSGPDWTCVLVTVY